MEWRNHSIALRTSETSVTLPLDSCKGGEPDSATPMHDYVKALERTWDICENRPSVPHFEGEGESQIEMANSPAEKIPAPALSHGPPEEIPSAPNDFHVAERLSNIDAPSFIIFEKNSSAAQENEESNETIDSPESPAPNEFPVVKTSNPTNLALKTMYQYNRVEKLPPNVVIPLALREVIRMDQGCEYYPYPGQDPLRR
jgi:hypothetical protein